MGVGIVGNRVLGYHRYGFWIIYAVSRLGFYQTNLVRYIVVSLARKVSKLVQLNHYALCIGYSSDLECLDLSCDL